MAYYRLYFLENNRIQHFVEMECPSDETAVERVSEHGDGRTMELWQQHRLVKRWEPTGERTNLHWRSLK